MTFPDRLTAVLPPEMLEVWTRIAPIVPRQAYLVGGTAVTAHLGHRPSQDLDFFSQRPLDLDRLERALARRGKLAVTARDEGTLNCVLDSTVLQFLDASHQRLVESTMRVEGIRVAGIGDLLATKLNAVASRPALRDYVDLQAIEDRAHRFVEEGLALFVKRYRPKVADEAVAAVVRALASFDDAPDDPGLDLTVADVARYWKRRIPQITRHLGRWG